MKSVVRQTSSDRRSRGASQPARGGTAVQQAGSATPGGAIPAFEDHRPEAVAQRGLQEVANQGSQSGKAAQLKAAIQNRPGQTAQRRRLDRVFGQATQRQVAPEEEELQMKAAPAPVRPPNRTGLPNNLKAGIENLSGLAMDDVKVHFNSPRPAGLRALAYTQGTDIHVGPGQEQHLAHEAWHVAQQKQGRVRPTMRIAETSVNDSATLEREADVMGSRALQMKRAAPPETETALPNAGSRRAAAVQRYLGQAEAGREVKVWVASADQLVRGVIAEPYDEAAETYNGFASVQITHAWEGGAWVEDDGFVGIDPSFIYPIATDNETILAENPAMFAPGEAEAEVATGRVTGEGSGGGSGGGAGEGKRKGSGAGHEESSDEGEPDWDYDEAFAFLAGSLGMEEAELRQFEETDPELFEGLEYYSEEDLEDGESFDVFAATIAGLQWKYKKMPTGGGGGGGSSSGWAASGVRSAARSIADAGPATIFPGGRYTIHHKVSQSQLRKLFAQMTAAGAAAEPVRRFLAGISPLVGATSQLKLLLNMPANLEVGPPGDLRVGDPGEGFDPNVPMTPRSTILGRVSGMITSGVDDWAGLAGLLERAHQRHVATARGAILSAPILDQWAKSKGGKLERAGSR